MQTNTIERLAGGFRKMADNVASGWTIDRKIPVAVVLMLMANVMAFSYQAATQNARIGQLENNQGQMQQALAKLADNNQQTQTGIAVINSQLGGISKTLEAQARMSLR